MLHILKFLMSMGVLLRPGVKRTTLLIHRSVISCHSRRASRYEKCPVFVWFRVHVKSVTQLVKRVFFVMPFDLKLSVFSV